MIKRVSRISVFQTSKVFALIVLIFSAVIAWPMAVYSLFTNETQQAFVFLIIPFIYGIFGFIMYAIMFWIYNLIAASFGGIEITVEDRRE